MLKKGLGSCLEETLIWREWLFSFDCCFEKLKPGYHEGAGLYFKGCFGKYPGKTILAIMFAVPLYN
jgi:hypothetical protein